MNRAKADMTMATYLRTLEWVKYFVKRGTQTELNLSGTGESTMVTDFAEYARLGREAIGPDRYLILTTNGILFTREFALSIRPYNMKVFVSNHRPEKAKLAIDVAREFGMLVSTSNDPAEKSVDWAGQIKEWKVTAPASECPWMGLGWVFVLSDGRIAPCSYEGDGSNAFAHVDDDPSTTMTMPSLLCRSCHQVITQPDFDQRNADAVVQNDKLVSLMLPSRAP